VAENRLLDTNVLVYAYDASETSGARSLKRSWTMSGVLAEAW
jgi:predicted nucleic acid-binding protein